LNTEDWRHAAEMWHVHTANSFGADIYKSWLWTGCICRLKSTLICMVIWSHVRT